MRHAGFVAVAWLLAGSAMAADPITLTAANTADHPVTYGAGPFVVPSAQAGCDPVADNDLCDDTTLTVQLGATGEGQRIVVQILWGEPTQTDFDLTVFQDNQRVASSASTTDPEIARFGAVDGAYLLSVAAYQPLGNSFTASVWYEPIPPTSTPPAGPLASFEVFPPPAGMGNGGEPSIGANWMTGSVVVGNSDEALFITFDDTQTPPKATWVNRAPPTNVASFDPILFTDRESGLTVVSQLVTDPVQFSTGCSLSSRTTDDGVTWVASEGCGPPAGADHQAVGGGPYHDPFPALPGPLSFPAIYYCAQSVSGVIGDATCSRSDDGGITYGPGVVVYTSECGGIHGHPRVAPDGTVYLPNRVCGGGTLTLGQGMAISVDNGLHWTFSLIPGSTPGASDPSIATGLNEVGKQKDQASNTVYFGYCDGDGLAKVAVSHDQGQTWTNVFDVGASKGIKNCVFPEMIAGDDNRASLFFLGTTTPGAYQGEDFRGEWHGYVATTYDGGFSWGLYDATPDDPVQLGPVCLGGISCTNSAKIGNSRNLLDFNDISVDLQGRAVFVFADGCVAPKCASGGAPRKSRSALETVGRHSGGKTLFSEYDATVGSHDVAGATPPPELPEGDPAYHLFGGLGPALLAPLFVAALRRRRRSS